jgi:hypothetical protein
MGVLSVKPIIECGCEINIINKSINNFNVLTFIHIPDLAETIIAVDTKDCKHTFAC